MTLTFQLGKQEFKVQADSAKETTGGLILHGPQVHLHLPAPPVSYYRHGWQSWSLAAWHTPDFSLPVQKPSILHPMQTDPLYARHPAPNGCGLARGASRLG